MRVEEIGIFSDNRIGRPFRELGPIWARVTSGAGWNKARTVEDVNSKLREVALKKGANAVINVTYNRGVSLSSWKALTAEGLAVIAESVNRQCPFCAEMIKREAKVCRFCGKDVSDPYIYIRLQHPQSFDAVWEQAKDLDPWPEFPLPFLLEACLAVEEATSPVDAVMRAFALVPFAHMRKQHPDAFDSVWNEATQFEPWPKSPIPAMLAACLAVERGDSPKVAVDSAFAIAIAEGGTGLTENS
jgi:hypothetical protein